MVYMRVCLGGTFDLLHRGHKKLIDTAFKHAGANGFVFIGITVGEMLYSKPSVKKFINREKIVRRYISGKKFQVAFEIQPISDKYGPSITGEFDCIVVSSETKKTAVEINMKRKTFGKSPLKIVEIPMLNADDGLQISSTRIRNKEIDENGHIKIRD